MLKWCVVRDKDGNVIEPTPKPEPKPKAKPEAKKRGRPKSEPQEGLEAELGQHMKKRPYQGIESKVIERLAALEAASPVEEMAALKQQLAARDAEIAALKKASPSAGAEADELSAEEKLAVALENSFITPPAKKSIDLLIDEAHRLQALTSPDSDVKTPEQQGQLGAVCGKAYAESSAEAGAVGGAQGYLGAEKGRQLGHLGKSSGQAGASSGKLGASSGHLGGNFGYLGGRPKNEPLEPEPEGGAVPDQWLKQNLNPRKFEPNAASVKKFQEYCRTKLKEEGKGDSELDSDFMKRRVQRYFPGKTTRYLMSVWNDTEKAARVEELELGTRGAIRKKGEHSILRLHLGKGIRALAKPESNKKSAFHSMFLSVEEKFKKWRAAGQYVDKYDLLVEFQELLKAKIDDLENEQRITGGLTASRIKLLDACKKKRDKMHDKQKNQEKTVEQMQKLFGCRLLKPQRLCSMSLDEEAERVCETWYLFDFVMWLAAFADIEELAEHIIDPVEFRKNIKATVICMSDQMPFYIKLQPGKQLYTRDEVAAGKRKKPLTELEREQALGSKGGGGSTKADKLISFDVAEDDNEGMTQTRGESHGNQDKFRITLDLEQCLGGWFDEEVEPKGWTGITSMILIGAHFNEDNVSIPTSAGEKPVYLEDELYEVNGKEISHKKGEAIEMNRGAAILQFRADHPELYAEMKKMNIRFYQQPAGFEGRGA